MDKLKSFKQFEINQKSQKKVVGGKKSTKTPKGNKFNMNDSQADEDNNDETEMNVSISNLASF